MLSLGISTFRVMSDKQIRAHFKYCQIKSHVQTARELHDLNMTSDGFTLHRICYAKLIETAKIHVAL